MSPVKTIILDIDGTLIEHKGTLSEVVNTSSPEDQALDGTVDKMDEWDSKGYNIVLITGRRESSRAFTEKQLADMNIFYDQLIMGVGGGERHLINDRKPDGTKTSYAHNLVRNKVIKNLKI